MIFHWISRSAVSIAAVVGSLALFSLWLVPGNVAESQNRARVQFPTLDSPAALGDVETFARVDRALRDQLGAQVPVVHGVGVFSSAVGLSPNSTTYLGVEREPFFASDFVFPCRATPERVDAVLAGLTKDASAIAKAGNYVVYTVAPDKSSIRESRLGVFRDSLTRCSDKVRSTFTGWSEEQAIPLITLWEDLEALDSSRQGREDGAYYFGDSHWNADGATVWTSALLSRLVDDGVAPTSILRDLASPEQIGGETVIPDLFRNIGLRDTVERVDLVYDRDGVTTNTGTTTSSGGATLTHVTSSSTHAELIPGRTLILGDSFLRTHAAKQLAPFFADVTFGSLADFEDIGMYDVVIVERVQRNAMEPGWPAFSSVLDVP